MNLSEWRIIIALILNIVLTMRHFSSSSPASATETQKAAQEKDAIMFMNVRLAGENMQWSRKYEQLEEDYRAVMLKLTETEQRLERRTKALTACRELLNSKQGIEDSGDMIP